MGKRSVFRFLVLLSLLCLPAVADEGMWLFDHPPLDRLARDYGFRPTRGWLDRLRLGAVRFVNGGSGSLVSADGLVFTNHHVGRECVQDLSTGERDYIRNGFYARTTAEERPCPDFELNVLERIEDVTAQVHAAAPPGSSAAEAGQLQRQRITQLETACARRQESSEGSAQSQTPAQGPRRPPIRCEVVRFYAGGLYQLYRYRRYTDVRLVFAPEESIAFFGGDPDNFEFPRYDLDVAFFRIYENGRPARIKNYLHFSFAGVREGELVFVAGNPGRTERLLTMAQLRLSRDVQTPFQIDIFTRRYADLKRFSDASAENARVAADDFFGLENALKALRGRLAGLRDQELMNKKEAAEQALRRAVAASSTAQPLYGGAWEAIDRAVERERQIFVPHYFLEAGGGFDGTETRLAWLLVRLAIERQKPSEQRLREYSDAHLASLERQLFSPAPISKPLDASELASSLVLMQEKLGPEHPAVKLALGGLTPQAAAENVIARTRLHEVEFRRQLYAGGLAAMEQSADPLIVMMRQIDPLSRAARKQWEDEVESVLSANGTRIAQARFATEGTRLYPDATFTLRLSYGAVKGYEQNGQAIPYTTDLGGAFARAEQHGNRAPYELPASWLRAKPQLRPATPFNFVSTADIIGGNSGSPTVNRQGELVGIVFDGNIQSLSWDFAYDDRQGRAVHVDSRAIFEALRVVYHAEELAGELSQGKRK